jgi:hypothetical protein
VAGIQIPHRCGYPFSGHRSCQPPQRHDHILPADRFARDEIGTRGARRPDAPTAHPALTTVGEALCRGAHWLTDVLVAWTLALAWLSIVITAHRLFLTIRRRHPAA